MGEDICRTMTSLLETRPSYLHRDETIRGHVLCSCQALVLRKELERRLEARGYELEWADAVRDLNAVQEG